jgi:hypothetical protein
MSDETENMMWREGEWASFVFVDPPFGVLDVKWDTIDYQTLQYFAYAASAALIKKHCCVMFNGWQVWLRPAPHCAALAMPLTRNGGRIRLSVGP